MKASLIAIWRANYHNCPVILGSATPSLESRARAQKKVYTLLELPTRVNQKDLPEVEVVDMREELKSFKGGRPYAQVFGECCWKF